MISKSKAKFIISLKEKKRREEEQLFIIEGDKIVKEFLTAGTKVKSLIAQKDFISELSDDLILLANEVEEVSYSELKQISTLKTPHNALAVVPMPLRKFEMEDVFNDLSVALDLVQDPGNLGTIIRAAAWFGIKNIICSPNSVDLYNPKVIQASMGAILHVKIHYDDLQNLLKKAGDRKLPVFGAFLDGDSIYDHRLGNKGIILLGNESKGISQNLMPYITDKIKIPGPGTTLPGLESLNVGMAASIIISEFARRYNG
jgi:TrmH family RNA methyltransferase